MPRKTILLVEDNADSRIIFATILKRSGYRLLEAADALEAFTVLATEPVDLMLLDIELPEIDGWQIATEVRNADATSALPIIAVTAVDDTQSRARAGQLDFVDYLCKPIEPFRLAERVERAIGAAELQSDRAAGARR